MRIHVPKMWVLAGFGSLNGEQCHRDPKRLVLARKHVIGLGASRRISKQTKRYTKTPKHVTSHVFAETIYVVAAPWI